MKRILAGILLSGIVLADDYQPLILWHPIYPIEALEKCIEGYVILSFVINSNGEAIDIKVVDSKPKGVFEKAAIKNFKRSVASFVNDAKIGERTEQKFIFEMEIEDCKPKPS